MPTKPYAEISAEYVVREVGVRANQTFAQVTRTYRKKMGSLLASEAEELLRSMKVNPEALVRTLQEEFLSTSDAAKLLFVSRSHVIKLVEEGKLRLYQAAGQGQSLRRSRVQEYKSTKMV